MPLSMTRMIAGADDDAEDRALAAAERDAAEDGGGDGVELVGDADLLGHLADVGGVADARQAAEAGGDDVGERLDAFDGDAGVLGGVAVAADGVDVAAEDGEVQHVARRSTIDQQEDEQRVGDRAGRRRSSKSPPLARSRSGESPRLSVPPWTIVCETPRSSSMPPSVTMNGWSLSRVMSSPWTRPMSSATPSATGCRSRASSRMPAGRRAPRSWR